MTASLHSRTDSKGIAEVLPDRNDSDIPQQVQWFLSVCEAAVASYRWGKEHYDSPAFHFTAGVVDYWWEDDLIEPRFEMLFRRPLDPDERWEGFPSYKRFCYQQGAKVGYQLREQYGR